MKVDYKTPGQSNWLGPDGKNTPDCGDLVIYGGICMALCYEWACRVAKGEEPTETNFVDQTAQGVELGRLISFQRAWNLRWVEPGRSTGYDGFERNLMTVAGRHLHQCGKHDELNFKKASLKEKSCLNDCAPILDSMKKGDVFLLLLIGKQRPKVSDPKTMGLPPRWRPPSVSGEGAGFRHKGWGHVVAAGASTKIMYFDPNGGQNSCSLGTPGVGKLLAETLADYDSDVCVPFHCSKA